VLAARLDITVLAARLDIAHKIVWANNFARAALHFRNYML
jgi:hypothetical protein